jgi:Restriction Enzyme Adenine Methylase Associated
MITVLDLLKQEIITEGQSLVWHRRSLGITYSARVATNGSIITSDGKEHKTPSGAAKHFGRKPIDGWNAWKIKETGESLASLRARLR